MRCLLQYVVEAKIVINNHHHAKINTGLCVFVGFNQTDNTTTLRKMSHKLINCRTIPDENRKLNRSILEIHNEILLVPQFTLYARTKSGHRPSFQDAAKPATAKKFYYQFVHILEKHNLTVRSGVFGAYMEVTLTNAGPITLLLEY